MEKKEEDREELIYSKIRELQSGTLQDREVAFECIGILGNESSNDTLEERLNKVESLINK